MRLRIKELRFYPKLKIQKSNKAESCLIDSALLLILKLILILNLIPKIKAYPYIKYIKLFRF